MAAKTDKVPCSCMTDAANLALETMLAVEIMEYEVKGQLPPWVRTSMRNVARDLGKNAGPLVQEIQRKGTSRHHLEEAKRAMSALVDNCGFSPISQAPLSRGKDLRSLIDELVARPDPGLGDSLVDGVMDNISWACRE